MEENEMTFICVLAILVILYLTLYRFVPRNSNDIYSLVIAHRGLHLFAPENTKGAYEAALKANMAIELDVRRTKDKVLVCFHDRYTTRLLGIPGKLEIFDLETLRRYHILKSEYSIVTFEEALKTISGKVDVLVEVKGKVDEEYIESLIKLQREYPKELYFHAKNLLAYFKLKKSFGSKLNGQKRVFWVSNIFRKRFKFVKGKDYKAQVKKYNALASDVDVEIPSISDISNLIVNSIETLEDKKEILATIGSVLNRYETRIKDKNHFVYNSLWLHRAISSNYYTEHSRAAFEECKWYANEYDVPITVEFDVMLYKGEVKCYHKDRISNILGQKKSCADKEKIQNAMRFKDVLKIFEGEKNINLAIDIKDYHLSNRVLEDLIILELSNYSGNFIIMSYNPMVLTYFKTVRPEWLRAQIGHSLKGLRKVPIFRFPAILNGVLGILFDMSCADCVVFDDSKWIYYLIAYHRNIKGKPVLIYAPKTYMEQEAFIGKESVANFIVENIEDKTAWPENYIEKFKK